MEKVENLDAYVRMMLMRTLLDVMAILRELPARRRAVLVLRFYLDLSVEETAAELGISTGPVKSQTARGLDALRDIFAKESGVKR